MRIENYINVNVDSRIPKYKQVIDSVFENINSGKLEMGDRIPSINQVAEECFLSRDTVEKAYSFLKKQKVIISVKGKGYYVAKTDLEIKSNILFLINKLSTYKMRVFNSFVQSVGHGIPINLDVYHCDPSTFIRILNKKKSLYTHFVIMPHFINERMQHFEGDEETMKALSEISPDKLIILDRDINGFSSLAGRVVQDFRKDIYDALSSTLEKINNYKKVILVYPQKALYPYPKDILIGFRSFCIHNKLDFEVIDEVYESMEFQNKDLFIVIQENDLVELVKQTRDRHYKLGEEIGIISYNDTPLKELLGISVISTDFVEMGTAAAEMIFAKEKIHINNNFRFIDRRSH